MININNNSQGVIVLSRQWKSILYNPMLFEHQYKGKLNRPNLSSAFSAPTMDDVSLKFSLLKNLLCHKNYISNAQKNCLNLISNDFNLT